MKLMLLVARVRFVKVRWALVGAFFDELDSEGARRWD